MEYEGSIGYVSRKMKKNIADFHVLGLFIAKKHDLSEKKFRLSRAGAVAAEILAPAVFWANLMYLILTILKLKILKVPPLQIPPKKS
jgi:hypothetical protein